MGNSLRDQLHKAGLISEKQVKKASKDARKQTQKERHGAASQVETAKQQAQKASLEKAERDRQLNLERAQAAERAAVAAQIKQIIDANAVPISTGDIDYHFLRDGKVKTLGVTPELQAQIARGSLIIVALDTGYALLPASFLGKIRERDPGYFVVDALAGESEIPDEYSAYQIPDDLYW